MDRPWNSFLVCVALVLPVGAQDARQSEMQPAEKPLRQIVDPATGDRWVLLRNLEHPEAPGRLIRTGRSVADADLRLVPTPPPVIRSGEVVLVEDHTPVVDAHFDGVALQTARPGDELRVRLKANGNIVRAVAVGPGRVNLRSSEGVAQ